MSKYGWLDPKDIKRIKKDYQRRKADIEYYRMAEGDTP